MTDIRGIRDALKHTQDMVELYRSDIENALATGRSAARYESWLALYESKAAQIAAILRTAVAA